MKSGAVVSIEAREGVGLRTMSVISASVPTRTTAAMSGMKTSMQRRVKFAKRGSLGSTIDAAGERRSEARPATRGSSVRLKRRNRTERPPTTAARRRSGV